MSARPVPEGRYVRLASGLRLHLHDVGEGPVLVWLHGSGNGACGHSNFQGNYPEIAAAGYRCLVPDLPGFGYSDKPLDLEYHLDVFVDAVHGLLQALDVKQATLIGNSLGGAVALAHALKYPAQVERLVLMAPGGLNDLADYLAMPGMQAMFALYGSGQPPTPAQLKTFFQTAFVADPAMVSDALVAERAALAATQPPRVIQTLKVPNLTGRLSEIRCPALTLWGLNEKMMPESGILRLAKGLKNGRLVLVPNCGHWVMIEHRALFNRYVLDFLRNG
jgi:4,5:9,10-diseco-3-hydroxy-5,9,17-trioxoandrosta-1(10),2-diene-4-oate hydrolase